ncbi:hypothetical protein RRG08_035788 [Elysia crispata]|uniref:Uncharacterized protein n=1 Tax=Elysia crispata TaxID=231223 RepID=A0AAE1DJJ0_9GAST|nr:hypothetical protein RRG08_035788 [Elysia crispata]
MGLEERKIFRLKYREKKETVCSAFTSVVKILVPTSWSLFRGAGRDYSALGLGGSSIIRVLILLAKADAVLVTEPFNLPTQISQKTG